MVNYDADFFGSLLMVMGAAIFSVFLNRIIPSDFGGFNWAVIGLAYLLFLGGYRLTKRDYTDGILIIMASILILIGILNVKL